MVDFAKLNDPEHRARARADREAAEAIQAKRDGLIDSAIERCALHIEILSAREAEFVRSVQMRQRTFSPATPAQVRWLADIERALDSRLGIITVTQGLRGHFAVHYKIGEDGCPEPEQSGLGSYSTPGGAAEEARAWANSEGLRCSVDGHEEELLIDHLKATGEYVEHPANARNAQANASHAGAIAPAASTEATQAVAAGRRTIEAIRARSRNRP
ncbi:hypothetical protein [Hydrogenophaga sp. 2FB]|uniref:hypothetical protein n=1 Tax=Hydrogenophaga sp. 2FB TaxID=2502187 RepID=UPI0010F64FBB|nr:hypothetical protein [Hydrogenophaga sp. 2FB]